MKKKLQGMPKNVLVTMYATAVFSVLIHGVMFVNNFVNGDSIVNADVHNLIWLTHQGRWMNYFVGLVRGFVTTPWIVGLLGIAYLIIAAMLTVSILDIRSKVSCVIVSLLLVAFPSWPVMFAYGNADSFTAALLFSAAGVFFTVKYRFGFVPGALCLMLSLAIYQSFLGFSMVLFLMLLIKQASDKSSSHKIILSNASKYLLCGILGYAAYYISVQISVMITGLELSGYRGIGDTWWIGLSEIPNVLRRSYGGFLMFFIDGLWFRISNVLLFAYAVMWLLTGVFLFGIVFISKAYKQIFNLLVIVVCLLCIPLGANIIAGLSSDVGTDILTVYQFVLVFVFLVMLGEIFTDSVLSSQCKQKFMKYLVLNWASVAIVVIIAFNFVIFSGQVYLMISTYNQRTFGFYNRVLARIESLEDFNPHYPLLFVFSEPHRLGHNSPPPFFHLADELPGFWHEFVGIGVNFEWARSRPVRYISIRLGVYFRNASEAERNRVILSNDFRRMSTWPHPDSVAVVENVIVVRFGPHTQQVYMPGVSLYVVHMGDWRYNISGSVSGTGEGYVFRWRMYADWVNVHEFFEENLTDFVFDFPEHRNVQVSVLVFRPDGSLHMPQSYWAFSNPGGSDEQ